jgi:hypothetical protein
MEREYWRICQKWIDHPCRRRALEQHSNNITGFMK